MDTRNLIIEKIKQHFPENARELGESAEIFILTLNDILKETAESISRSILERDSENDIKEYLEISNFIKKTIDDFLSFKESCIDKTEFDENEDEEMSGLKEDKNAYWDYSNCKVDRDKPHSIFEDLSNTGICGFSIKEEYIPVNNWRAALVEICNQLSEITLDKVKEFPEINSIQDLGKKVFSRNQFDLERPKKIKNTDIFIEGKLEFTEIQAVIRRIFEKCNVPVADLKLYIRHNFNLREKTG